MPTENEQRMRKALERIRDFPYLGMKASRAMIDIAREGLLEPPGATEDSLAIERAIAAGWSRDGDGWWVRPFNDDPFRAGLLYAQSKTVRSVGGPCACFVDEEAVYCRTPSVALEFDRAVGQ